MIAQGYDSSQNYDNNYYDNSYNHGQSSRRHQDWDQDASDGHRRGGGNFGGPKKRMLPSEASSHVIFLGLDPDFTEADVRMTILTTSLRLFP